MYFFLFGLHNIESIISHQPQRVIRLIFFKHTFFNISNLKIPYEIWPSNIFNKIFKKETKTQGICLIATKFSYTKIQDISFPLPLCVILNEIENPGNLGRAIRSSFLLGVKLIILTKKKSSPISPLVEKISNGFSSQIPIIYSNNLNQTLNFLKKNQMWIIGSCINSKQLNCIHSFKFPNNIAIIIGNESYGIRNNIIKKCDFLIKIPTCTNLPLNAADALLIFLYEISKKNFFNL